MGAMEVDAAEDSSAPGFLLAQGKEVQQEYIVRGTRHRNKVSSTPRLRLAQGEESE